MNTHDVMQTSVVDSESLTGSHEGLFFSFEEEGVEALSSAPTTSEFRESVMKSAEALQAIAAAGRKATVRVPMRLGDWPHWVEGCNASLLDRAGSATRWCEGHPRTWTAMDWEVLIEVTILENCRSTGGDPSNVIRGLVSHDDTAVEFLANYDPLGEDYTNGGLLLPNIATIKTALWGSLLMACRAHRGMDEIPVAHTALFYAIYEDYGVIVRREDYDREQQPIIVAEARRILGWDTLQGLGEHGNLFCAGDCTLNSITPLCWLDWFTRRLALHEVILRKRQSMEARARHDIPGLEGLGDCQVYIASVFTKMQGLPAYEPLEQFLCMLRNIVFRVCRSHGCEDVKDVSGLMADTYRFSD